MERVAVFVVLCCLSLFSSRALAKDLVHSSKYPNIIFILADDMGWNDLSFNGSPQIPTPNIDALKDDGVLFDQYYVQASCSPTRASFLTGRHIIHTGLYRAYDYRSNNGFLNTSFDLLPTYLKTCCNYSTHLVGKWHLGLTTMSTLPLSRGFDTHFGYWYGVENHQYHRTYGAYDFNDQMKIAVEYNGTFSTPLFVDRASEIIRNSLSTDQPFFLYLSFQDVHWPLQAPIEYIERFANSTGGDIKRQIVCAMAAHLDDAVGNITKTLKETGLWDHNTLVIFSSDNGGPTNGDEVTASNNYPLRGGKNTLWQGGVRVPAIVRGPGILKRSGYINHEKLHVTDWFPSLLSMALLYEGKGRVWQELIPTSQPPFQFGDGYNSWSTISMGTASPRDWVLLETHSADELDRVHGDSLIVDKWKLIRYVDSIHETLQNGWFPPPGQDSRSTPYTVVCDEYPNIPDWVHRSECKDDWCLFDLLQDPCERHNVAITNPAVLQRMLSQLDVFQATAVPQGVLGCTPIKVPIGDDEYAWQPCDVS
jgi:arylsulfatase B